MADALVGKGKKAATGRHGHPASGNRDDRQSRNQYVYYRQLAEFTIESKKELHLNLDGEPTLERRMKFTVLPSHLGVVF